MNRNDVFQRFSLQIKSPARLGLIAIFNQADKEFGETRMQFDRGGREKNGDAHFEVGKSTSKQLFMKVKCHDQVLMAIQYSTYARFSNNFLFCIAAAAFLRSTPHLGQLYRQKYTAMHENDISIDLPFPSWLKCM